MQAHVVEAAVIRVSFLAHADALQDTMQVFTNHGCMPSSVAAFKKSVEDYFCAGFNLNLSRFPKPDQGFYFFKGVSNFSKAFTNDFKNGSLTNELNCFDLVFILADQHLRLLGRSSDANIKSEAVNTSVFQAKVPNYFSELYSAEYVRYTRSLISESTHQNRVKLTEIICKMHYFTNAVDGLERGECDINTIVKGGKIVFPESFEVVFLHALDASQGALITYHAGLIFSLGKGDYMYIEKLGGKGPFLRIDLKDKSDLLLWFSEMNKSFHGQFGKFYLTFNDRRMLPVP